MQNQPITSVAYNVNKLGETFDLNPENYQFHGKENTDNDLNVN